LRQIASTGATSRRAPANGEGERARRPERHDTRGPEVEALKLAVHRPGDVADRLDDVLFDDELHLAAYRALAESHTLIEAIERADPGAATLLQRLAVEEADADPDDVIALLVDRATRRALADLEAEVRADETRVAEVAPVIEWLKRTSAELREPATNVDAATRLVAWLAKQAEEDASD
jgi:hypothetical protein